jgi:hypothetical protein
VHLRAAGTGIPARMQVSMVRQLSSANFIGGTTKQFELLTKCRARQAASPPATRCNSSMQPATWAGSENEVPTCLVVPQSAP